MRGRRSSVVRRGSEDRMGMLEVKVEAFAAKNGKI